MKYYITEGIGIPILDDTSIHVRTCQFVSVQRPPWGVKNPLIAYCIYREICVLYIKEAQVVQMS